MMFVIQIGTMIFVVQAPSMKAALEAALLDGQSRFALAGFEAGAEVDLVEELGDKALAFFGKGQFSISAIEKVIEYDPEAEEVRER